MNSSMVDDGVCDCCDGSDERPGACPNVCLKAGRAAVKALAKEIKAREEGISARGDYVADAMLLRKKWKARLSEIEIDGELGAAQTKAAAAAAELARLEKQLEAIEARKTAAEAASKPAAEPEQPAEEQSADADAADAAATEEAEILEEEAEQDAAVEEEEESDEDRAKRVASQWIPKEGGDAADAEEVEEAEEEAYDPAAAAAADGADDTAAAAPASSLTPEEEEALLAEVRLGAVAAAKAWAAGLLSKVTGRSADAAALERLSVAADVLRRRVNVAREASTSADAAVDTLKAEAADLKEREGRTYGPDDAYAKLADTCIDAKIEKYVYKVCPFSNAEQVDGGRSTGLGSWAGFDESGEHMVFTNGEGCWQGPARSMKVRVVCGEKEVLSRVAEPSRCEYTAQLATPAACDDTGMTALRQKHYLMQFYMDKAEKEAAKVTPVHDEL